MPRFVSAARFPRVSSQLHNLICPADSLRTPSFSSRGDLLFQRTSYNFFSPSPVVSAPAFLTLWRSVFVMDRNVISVGIVRSLHKGSSWRYRSCRAIFNVGWCAGRMWGEGSWMSGQCTFPFKIRLQSVTKKGEEKAMKLQSHAEPQIVSWSASKIDFHSGLDVNNFPCVSLSRTKRRVFYLK